MAKTALSETQIRLNEIFSVEKILSSRGFHVSQQGILESTLIDGGEEDRYFDIFNDEIKRGELWNCIPNTNRCIDTQFSGLAKINSDSNYQDLVKQFSTTFEWYVGKLIEKEFSAFSSSFGVEVSNINPLNSSDLGDFDSLVVLRNLDILYLECKVGSQSSNRLTLKKIMSAINRGVSLHTAATVMFLDRGINPKDLYRELQDRKCPIAEREDNILALSIRGEADESSLVYKWCDCFFLNAGAEYGNVKSKLNTVFRIIAAEKKISSIGAASCTAIPFDTAAYNDLGYNCKIITE